MNEFNGFNETEFVFWTELNNVMWYHRGKDIISDVEYKCVIDDVEYFIRRNNNMWELICNDVVLDKDSMRFDVQYRILKTIKDKI